MNRPTDGHILLVGEGNFSLSASLLESGVVSGPQLIASCIETFTAVQEAHQLAASNIEFLEKAGGTVLFEVDATDLHNHSDVNFFQFERVIFNFPLADRHNIKKNRALLSDFFSSVKSILDPEKGQVMVTLCKGQGGTPADKPLRSWHDSWQVVSMAANAGFILTEIHPFQAENFPRYKSVGFRFQDKGFNTDNALTHVFEAARSVGVPNISTSRPFIPQGDEKFVVPPYIRRKHDRWSLLEKKNHPVCTLHHHFAARLSHSFPDVVILPSNYAAVPKVLRGYVSTLHVKPCDDKDTEMEVESQQTDEGELLLETEGEVYEHSVATSKDLKDSENFEKLAAGLQTSDAEGNDRSGCESVLSSVSQESKDTLPTVTEGSKTSKTFRHGVEGADAVKDHGDGPSVGTVTNSANIFPAVVCPVYVVHKQSHSSDTGASCHVSKSGSVAEGRAEDKGEESVETVHDEHDGSVEVAAMVTADEASLSVAEDSAKAKDFDNGDGTEMPSGQSLSADTLFHLRCSLLENVPHLHNYMKTKSSKAVVMSGIVYHKCPISLFELPASHETIILSETETGSVGDLANQLCAALKVVFGGETVAEVTTKTSSTCLTIGDETNITVSVALLLETQSDQKCVALGHVFMMDGDEHMGRQGTGLSGAMGSSSRCVIGAILYLDSIAYHALHLSDARLLWSEDMRFISQFSQHHDPLVSFPSFKPFSLYPVRFVHDISFWENPKCLFDEQEFLDVVREVADDHVTCAYLVDKFEDTERNKISRCYRLIFQSHDHALSYITSWKLQSVLRLKVGQCLGVVLR